MELLGLNTEAYITLLELVLRRGEKKVGFVWGEQWGDRNYSFSWHTSLGSSVSLTVWLVTI